MDLIFKALLLLGKSRQPITQCQQPPSTHKSTIPLHQDREKARGFIGKNGDLKLDQVHAREGKYAKRSIVEFVIRSSACCCYILLIKKISLLECSCGWRRTKLEQPRLLREKYEGSLPYRCSKGDWFWKN